MRVASLAVRSSAREARAGARAVASAVAGAIDDGGAVRVAATGARSRHRRDAARRRPSRAPRAGSSAASRSGRRPRPARSHRGGLAHVGRVDAVLRRDVVHRARQGAEIGRAVGAVADDRLADEDLEASGSAGLDVARALHRRATWCPVTISYRIAPTSRRSRWRRPARGCAAARARRQCLSRGLVGTSASLGSGARCRRRPGRWPTGGRRGARRERASPAGPGRPGTMTAMASSSDMRRPSSRRASSSERRVIAGGIDCARCRARIEDASGMAMIIAPDYGRAHGQLNGSRAARCTLGGIDMHPPAGIYRSRASSATTVRPPMTSPESAATADRRDSFAR